MRKNKILLPVSIIAIIVAISMTTIFTFAFFNTSSIDSNSVKTGDVNISIIENEYDGVLDDNGNTDEKTFSVKSLGSKSTYSRVKITPSLEYYNDITNTWDVCGFINTDNIKYDISSPSWVESNGYYYNKFIMNKNDVSDDFSIKNISVNKDELDKEESCLYRVVFSVTAEGCQASNDNYKLTWGSDCVLPEEIEQFKDSDIIVS